MRGTGLGSTLPASFCLALLGLQAAGAASLPTDVGTCSETAIEEIGTRLGTPDSGSVVSLVNGVQISYDPVPHQFASRRSRECVPCLRSRGLPAGRRSRQIYAPPISGTGESWELPDSQHSCGGA